MKFYASFLVFTLFSLCALGETLEARATAEKWTFKYQVPKRVFAKGLRPHAASRKVIERKFHVADVTLPKTFSLSSKATLSPIFDQGQCGSCVYNSVTKNLQDSYLLRQVPVPVLSRQYLIDYGTGGGCNGSDFETEGQDLVTLGGLPSEASYPYVARNERKQPLQGQLYAKIATYQVITSSPKSIMTAIYSGYPVSITVGADNAFESYVSGIYNACSHKATNHEVILEGWDCETNIDANGNCTFDAQGNLPAGVGTWELVNSWGTSWGNNGEMTIKMTDSNGNLCNNVAQEAGTLETGIPMPQPVPPVPPTPPTPPTPPAPAPTSGLPLWVWITLGALGLTSIGLLIVVIVKK